MALLGRAAADRDDVASVPGHRGRSRAAGSARTACRCCAIPDVSYYLRQERAGLILGPYERQATPVWLDGHSRGLLIPALERRSRAARDLYRSRVPPRAVAGRGRRQARRQRPDPLLARRAARTWARRTGWPISFTATPSASASRRRAAPARRSPNGSSTADRNGICGRSIRAASATTPRAAYTVAKAVETYGLEYAPAFPYDERPAGRPLRTSPLHARLERAGARFGERGGWERALWYDRGGAAEATLSFRRAARLDGARSAPRCTPCATRVGIMDLPGFAQVQHRGCRCRSVRSTAWCARGCRGIDRIALGLCAQCPRRHRQRVHDHAAGPETFYLVGAAAAERHDDDWLRRACPPTVRCESSADGRYGTLVIAGPRARELLRQVTAADLSNDAFPWLSARWIDIGSARGAGAARQLCRRAGLGAARADRSTCRPSTKRCCAPAPRSA